MSGEPDESPNSKREPRIFYHKKNKPLRVFVKRIFVERTEKHGQKEEE